MQKSRVYKLLTWIVVCAQIMIVAGTATVGVVQPTPQMVAALAEEAGWGAWASAGLEVLTRQLQPLWGEPATAQASSIRDVGPHPNGQWLTTVHPEENLVVNGSFEMGPNGLNQTNIPGWTVASGKVDLWNGYFNPDGSNSEIDLAGTPGPGVLEQTLTGLTAGQSYFFEFSYSANTFANEQAKVQVLDGATALLDQTVTAAGHPYSAGWQHFRQSFTAPAGGSVKLRFQDLSVDPHIYHGVIIDDVRVVRRLINYVLNASFEAGPHGLNTIIIPNWTVESGRVDIHAAYFHPDRSRSELDLAGSPGPGIASQTVSGLTPGQSYIFEFDYTVNAFPNEQARVQVLDGATSLINQTVTANGDANHKGWKHFRQSFTAPASGSVILRFQDLNTDAFTFHGILIDNVRVADEPLNYVVNGDFENSPAALNIANDAIPGWTVVTGPVDVFNPGLLYEKMVDLNGSPGNGKIEQLVTGLTAGQVYAFQFNYQNHASWTTYAYARLLDSANVKLYEKRISCKGHVVHEGWCTLRYTFTAPANGQVKIVFENDEADGNAYYGVNVDNVFISRHLNYIVNGNLNSGPTGLNQNNVPGWSVGGPTDTHDNFGGEYRFTVDLNGSPGDGKLRQVVKGLAPGQPYTLRYNYASTAHNYPVNFDVKVTDSTGTSMLLNVSQSTDQLPYVGGWKQAEHTFIAPADGIVQVNFNNNETDNNPYYAAIIDNIQLWGAASVAGTEVNVCNGTIVLPKPPLTVAPGGVGAGLEHWVRADMEVYSDAGTTAAVEGDAVQQWNDLSGNGLDLTQSTAAQKPIYRAGVARGNFNPALDFSDDFIRNTSRVVQTTDDLTMIAVGDTDVTGGVRTLIGMGDNYNDPTIDLDGTWISPWFDGGGTVDLFTGETLPTSRAMIWGMRGNNENTNGMHFNYSGEDVAMNMTVNNQANYGQNIGLGSDGGGEDWDGRIPEAMVYSRNLSPAEMDKVYAYLAIKYGITMRLSTLANSTASGNYVSSKGALVWNYDGNSNYHNDVAGIARDDASALEQKQANSVNSDNLITIGLGGIAATNADNINNFDADQSFLLWGNDNGATTLATSVSVSLTRMARIWTVQETTPITAPIGVVTVRVPQSAFSLGAGQQAFLLRSVDPVFTNADNVIFFTCDGTNCETTIDFADGDYFTLARANVAPEISVTPGSSSFGNVGTSESSPVKNVTISNSGNAPLNLTSLQMTNDGGGQFTNNNGCGATLNPGANCTAGVTFTPNASGAQSGVLTIASNDSDEASVAVNLSGTGVAQAPDITVLPTTLSFTNTLVNSAAPAQSVVINNNGTGNLAIQNLSLGGVDSDQFVLVGPGSSCTPLTKNLADGESCDVEVVFSPTSVGNKSATLVIGSNDTDEITTTVTLNGVAATCSSALNTVTVTADMLETVDQDNKAAVCVTIAALPDLHIGKSGPVTATQNTNFAYTLVITNTSVSATSGVITVTDSLPAGLNFVSGSGSGFTCAASGQNVTCTSSSALAGNNGTATITLTVNSTTTGAKSNTASVIGGDDSSAATSNTVNTTVAASGTTMVVNTTADNTTAGDNNCTLREAITNANSNSDTTSGDCLTGSAVTTDTITFNIPGAGPHTIAPTSALPTITDELTIDGSTQPGASCGPTRTLLIVLNGASAGASVSGLNITSNGVTVRGLVINGFTAHGVTTTGSNGVIECNYIGVNTSGTAALGNLNHGINIQSAATNRIGTDGDGNNDSAEGNLIAGNGGHAVSVVSSTDTVIAGNLMGVDHTGTVDLGNGALGVFLSNGASNNRIGTNGDGIADAAERNVIAGNGTHGIHIFTNSSGNVVAGNYIGVNGSGAGALGNTITGVVIQSNSNNNRVGTNGDGVSDTAERNVISANGSRGVQIFNAHNNVVAGNYLGTDGAGLAALGNNVGVIIQNGASNNRVGTNGDGNHDVAERNVIAGNSNRGVQLESATTTDNIIAGNYIGVNATGAGALANGFHGVEVTDASNNRIGGVNAAQSNLIAYNGRIGITINGAAANNAILGNSIFGNGQLGIDLDVNGVMPNDTGDSDSGANDKLNHPVIRTVSGTTVNLYYDVPAGNYLLQIYDNPSGLDGSKYGEGETRIFTKTVAITTGGMNDTAILSAAPSNSGQRLAATLTEDLGGGVYGATSEFSGPDSVANNDTFTVTANSIGNVLNLTANDTTAWYTDTLTLSSVGTPNGGTITAFSSVAVTYDAPAAVGVYTFSYGITNTAKVTAIAMATVNVTGVPDLIISKRGSVTATQGTQFAYTLVVTNTGTAATSGVITVTDTLPVGLGFVSGSGGGFTCAASGQTVTCTSSAAIAVNGTATINLTVTPTAAGLVSNSASVSGGGDSSAATSNTVNTTVNANAVAPTITSGGGGVNATVSIPENTTVGTTVTASGTAPITYSIVGGADAAKFTINPNTGALSFVTAPDYEAPTDNGGDNIYDITVRASNSAGTDDQAIAITVTNVLGDAPVTLPVKVFLQGAYDSASGLLRDDLRSQNLLPTTAPYAAAATANAGVFAVTGNDAIVDWVLVELRDSTTPATVVTSKAALLQRDGDVVAVDGTSTLTFTVGAPSYYVAVKHRNHLGAMTSSAIALSGSTPTVDFTNPATPTYGTNAQRVSSGKALLWAGNANGDGSLIFAGPNNDRNGILAAVLGAPANSSHNANFIITGYRQDDVNLDGRTIAAGPGNDINVIGVTVFLHPGNGSGSANYLIAQQLP